MKIFGSTQYVKVSGEYADVKPLELYLKLEVQNQWDFNPNNYYSIYDEFTYYVILISKKDNDTYNVYKRLKEEDMTEEYKQLVNDYLKR